jgi:hypothetical protein
LPKTFAIFPPTQESMKLKSTLVCVAGLAAVMAMSGCASSRKTPFDAPRAATVIDVSSPDSGYAKVSQGINAGVFGVLAGLKKHQDDGGTVSPASIGPSVGGLVDGARTAVDDSCARVMVLEFADDGKRARIQTRCHQDFTVGQKVSVVRNLSGMDPRDILTVVPLQ